MMSFIELSLSFYGYYFYYLYEQKVFVLRNVVSLQKGFLWIPDKDEVLLKESSEMRHGIKLSKKQFPKTDEELKQRYQVCASKAHWSAVKTILKYLKRTKDIFLIYEYGELILEGYIDASFQSDNDDAKYQSSFVFKLNGSVVVWKSSKQESLKSCEEVKQNISGISLDENAIGYLHKYDRLDDVTSILQYMKEVYAIRDRHTSGEAHLKVGLDNDTYIDVIFQSPPHSYYPFIINFNLNGLESLINELINMLVQYEATIKKSVLTVLVGEFSTFKAKYKRVGCRKRKKGKLKAKAIVAATRPKSTPFAPKGMAKGKKKVGPQTVDDKRYLHPLS
ncbi:hypothetical protein Sango_0661100 [Sesamum angolense]|uniref:Uncharacterized protein n=1 Tax=Sesamum angolense TaxID=2727404 RepID=A0AAE1X7J7_9LAMI|nr:hypothetical protein Sango_0661100 [Sesamum angolense]